MSKQASDIERAQNAIENANNAAESGARSQAKKPVLKRSDYTAQQFQRDRDSFQRQHGGDK